MSLKGVRQLKEFTIRYSDFDGSSKGIREWMRTSLVKFATDNPDIQIKTELKRNKHPVFRGVYQNGNSKAVCVKNLDPERVQDFAMFIRNQIGYKMTGRYKKPIFVTQNPSIQGEWHERMDLIDKELKVELYYPLSGITAADAAAVAAKAKAATAAATPMEAETK